MKAKRYFGRRGVCSECQKKARADERRRIKNEAITYMGGKCEICGYADCENALEFHHIDPKKKKFNFSARSNTVTFRKLKREIDKCVLLCCRCHREVECGFSPCPTPPPSDWEWLDRGMLRLRQANCEKIF